MKFIYDSLNNENEIGHKIHNMRKDFLINKAFKRLLNDCYKEVYRFHEDYIILENDTNTKLDFYFKQGL